MLVAGGSAVSGSLASYDVCPGHKMGEVHPLSALQVSPGQPLARKRAGREAVPVTLGDAGDLSLNFQWLSGERE